MKRRVKRLEGLREKRDGTVYIILAFFIICSFFKHIDNAFCYKTEAPLASTILPLEKGVEYLQKLEKEDGFLKKIYIMFGTYARVNEGDLKLVLKNDDEVLETWTMQASELRDEAYQVFELNQAIYLDSGKDYYLGISETYSGENNVGVYVSEYGESVVADRTTPVGSAVCYQLTIENVHQKQVYRILYTLCVMLLIVGGMLFIGFDKFSVRRAVFLCVFLCMLFRLIDIDLLQNLAANVKNSDFETSDIYEEIKGGENADYEIFINQRTPFSIKLILENVNKRKLKKKLIHIKLAEKESGQLYLDQDITGKDVLGDVAAERTMVSLKLWEGGEKISSGVYLLTIGNSGRKSIQVNVTKEGRLNVCIEKTTFIAHRIAFLALVILTIMVLLVLRTIKITASISKVYLPMIIPLALVYFLLFLPWSSPDTGAHYQAIYRLSNIVMGYGEKYEWYGRQEDVDFYANVWQGSGSNPEIADYSAILGSTNLMCKKPDMVEFPTSLEHMEYYSLISYFPQVIGLSFARIMNFGAVPSIYFARLLTLILYIILTYYAVRKTPIGKGIFAFTALLPMCLMMSSALSYDTMVIISSLNFVSSIFCLYKNRQSKAILIETMFWAFIVGAVKGGGYLVLLPMSLILLSKDGKIQSVLRTLGIVAAGAVSIFIFDILLPAGSTLFQFGEEGTGKMAASFAIQKPFEFIDMCIRTYLRYADNLFFTGAGTRLAWLESVIPYLIIALMVAMGALYSIYEQDKLTLQRKDKYLIIITTILTIVTTPAMLLSWTPVGSQVVEGLQGRYYLPLLPGMLIVLTKFSLHIHFDDTGENKIIQGKIIIWYSSVSCVAVYYLLRLYLTR